ncbi:7TM diverse intracellular signaling domain-containing protein [Paraglaciecola sp.]|uniref:7TM diverse intracellular signaling domain-containing protein n=1 Tax=Paraglaciecola sp. TaxID=1920173 RepID=UPI003EFA1D29
MKKIYLVLCILTLYVVNIGFSIASSPNEVVSLNLSEINNQNISKQVKYYSLKNNTSSPPEYLTQLQSWLSHLTPHQTTDSLGDRYVVVFELFNDTQDVDWFVYPYGSVVEKIQIHTFNKNNKAEYFNTGHGLDNPQGLHYGGNIQVLPNQHKTVVMLFESEFFFAPIKILLKPHAEAKQLFQLEQVILLLSLGVSLALGIYNLFIFSTTRDKQYLNYALATLSYALGWATVFGVPEYIGLGSSKNWLMPSYLIGAVFYCLFNIQFLNLQQTEPKLAKFFQLLAIATVITIPFAFYSQGIGLYLASIFTSIVSISGLYAGIRCWIKGYSPAKYFVFALLSVVLPNMVGNFMNLGVLPGFNVNIYLLGLLGNCLDSLLLAYALAAKVRLLSIQNIELANTLEQTVDKRTQELTEANHKLEVINADLIEANETKGRFLATMSHEIRTPLTSIIGYADGILLGDIDKSEQDRVTKIIAQNGNHLLNVLNDILDLSKIEANKLDFESVPTHLFSILAQIESIVGKRARDKGLAFHLDYQYPLPAKIYTDPTRLKQILFNLTNNAIKFTEQGFIGLSISFQDDYLQIKVKDSGMGINSHHQQKLFEPFNQDNNSVNQKAGGTGLGLSISQRLAKGLNGHIEVESIPRKGSTFILKLKVHTVEDSKWINNVTEVWQSTPVRSLKTEVLPNFSGQKILLADDHPANRELISILLKRMNLDVVEVEDGRQALDAVFYQKFDLVLLDIHMPKMNGTDALKQIRDAGNYTPVVALTANNMKHEVEHYMRLGFSDHLAKPISRQIFITVLSKYLDKQGDVDNPINPNDMHQLVKDYQQDLAIQVEKAEKALEQRDLFLISEISHRIKGSASTFGFDIVGDKFADIEHSALQDDEIAVTYELPKALNLTRLCLELPGVDIAKGIINHNNSVSRLLKSIYGLFEHSEQSFNDLKEALDNSETNSALIHLYKFLPTVSDCGMEDLEQTFTALETLIQSGEVQKNTYQVHLKIIEEHLSVLTKAIQPILVDEF